MENSQSENSGSLASLGTKIDTLARGLEAMNGRIETLSGALGDMDSRLDERLTGVETRLSGVETHLADVGKQLANVQITADETKQFSRDSWDALKSLTRNMEERFEAAKKDQDEQFQLLHSAVRRWGERVEQIEHRPPRATKRRS